MKLEQFKVSNFRSIDSADLDIHDINVLIGKNNAGKSNVANSLYRYRDLITGSSPEEMYERVITRGRESRPVQFDVEFTIDKDVQKAIIDSLAAEYGLSSEAYDDLRDGSNFTWYNHELEIRRNGITRNTVKTNLNGEYIELGTVVDNEENTLIEQLDPSDITNEGRKTLSIRTHEVTDTFPEPFRSSIKSEFEGWKLIAPFRKPDAEGGFGAETVLDPSGENLTTVLQAIREDGTGRYGRICDKYKEVMEGVDDVRIQTVRNEDNEAVPKIRIDEKTSDGIDLEEISSGSKEILLLITKIITSEADASVLFIEEPELHLHPAAEKEIYDLILETVDGNGPQVVVTTHSDVFVDHVDLENIISIERDNYTRVETVDEASVVV